MGAGGLQALVKSGLPIARKRVLVAGSGPLLLPVAAYLRQCGAEISMICEQASRSSLARFGLALLLQPGKMRQGFFLRKQLSGIPYLADCWPVAARGHKALEEVVISQGFNIGTKTRTISCDYLACAFHLVPNTELAQLLRCSCEMVSCRPMIFSGRRCRKYFVPANQPASEAWNWRWSKARSLASRPAGALTLPNCFLQRAKKCAASHARSTGRLLYAANCGACPVLRQLFAGARMLRTRALRNAAPGVPPSCRRDVEWGRGRDACADPQPISYSTGLRTRCAHPFSPHVLKISARWPSKRKQNPAK